MVDVAEIRGLLDRLRAADPKLALFGASEHRYQLAPPIPAAELRAWEADYGIVLPDEYRTFMLELGNGGAGPFYGIFQLGMWDDRCEVDDNLDAPFPHRAAWNLPADRLEPPEDFDSEDDEDEWNAAFEAEYFAPDLLEGAFWICHHGCALRTALVVTGPERGNVWYDGRAHNAGIVPHTDASGRHLTFGAWYRGWLERSLREVGG